MASIKMRPQLPYPCRVPSSPDRASHFPAIEKRYGKPMSYWFTQMKKVKGKKYPEQMAFLQEEHGFSRAHANALVQYSRGSAEQQAAQALQVNLP